MLKEKLQERLTTEELWDIVEEMRQILGDAELLESLIKALGTDQAQDNLEYIARCWDL